MPLPAGDGLVDSRNPVDAVDGQHPAFHCDRAGHDLSILLLPAASVVFARAYEHALKADFGRWFPGDT